jgi:hypothetical protein
VLVHLSRSSERRADASAEAHSRYLNRTQRLSRRGMTMPIGPWSDARVAAMDFPHQWIKVQLLNQRQAQRLSLPAIGRAQHHDHHPLLRSKND